MGSLENGLSLKKDNLPSSSSANRVNIHSFLQRPRSKLSRFFLFQKLDYLQWICIVVIFSSFVVIFQMFLPGSVIEKPSNSVKDMFAKDLTFLKETGVLYFGEDIKFEPSKLLAKLQKESKEFSLFSSSLNTTRRRLGYRKPQLALIFADLSVDSHQILMVTVASALLEIGYAIEVYSLEDGPVCAVWGNIGVPVFTMKTNDSMETAVDWLNYDGILVNSLQASAILFQFLQEPFKSVPLIWTIHERALADRLRHYNSSGKIVLVNDWKRIFDRATVVFPNYALPMSYSMVDSGNYYVIPGSPGDVWDTDKFMVRYNDTLHVQMGNNSDNFVIAIVGSELLYKGLWLEHALVLQALFPLVQYFPYDNNFTSHLKIVILSGDSASNYSLAVETVAIKLGYQRGIVKNMAADMNADSVLSAADIVIYGSFREEQSFPGILVKAMCLGKPIVSPDLSMIRKYVDDRVNGYLFPKENIEFLTKKMLQLISKGKLAPLTKTVAMVGKSTARNLLASETIEGYARLIENVLRLPSEVASPKAVSDIPDKSEWSWHIFEPIIDSTYPNKTLRTWQYLNKIEQEWDHSRPQASASMDEAFIYSIWEEEKYIRVENDKRRLLDQELKDRTEQTRGTWEDVYRVAKRADRARNDLHERDERELERTGQPLCIYEPYFGEGAWKFLHLKSLYRGIGLSTKGRRPGEDDIDAPSRLPLLNNVYYRDALAEYGAFFAVANRIDRLHKSSWIGFQSWRATYRKASLSNIAEKALVDAIEARKHGDAFYFWVRMDTDKRNPLQLDFWSFCDAVNAGNCKLAFSEALKKMYGIKHDSDHLPPMPQDSGTWSVMHSWVLPTRSFLEFVMFSRMFVDALDSLIYEEHHRSGSCLLSLSRDKHCYSRVLELLINVWAYHSARRMVYVNPETGAMQEQHGLKTRRGRMWVKWFSYSTVKTMDEDLAEEWDTDAPQRRWLWPSTGEVFWQGVYEREKNLRQQQKERRKQQTRDKIQRMRRRSRQKVIGKYVKPAPEDGKPKQFR